MGKPTVVLLNAILPALVTTLLTLGMIFGVLSSQSLPSAYNYIKASVSPAAPNAIAFSAGLCNCSVEFVDLSSIWKPNVNCQCPSTTDSCPPAVPQEPIKEIVQVEKPCPENKPTVIQNVIKHEPWWAEGKVWHYPVKFPRCSMDACFNYSRCANMDTFRIYTYEDHHPPVRYFTNLNQSKWHTKDPEKACIFMVFLDTERPWPKHPRELAYWNNGLNHALVTFADKWSQRMVAEDSIGLASVVVSDAHETVFRPGFDVSIPLPPNYHFKDLQHLKPFERKYLITFRGLRYLGTNKEGVLRSFDSFRTIHNGADIIVVTSCRHFINDLIRKENSSMGAHCDEDDKLHSEYSSYGQLMNTTFGLVPAGIQPNSYRFSEVLSAGAIPILVADNYVKPFSNLITWYRCLLQFPSSEMHLIVAAVRAMSKSEVEQRQRACLSIYHAHFRDEQTLLESTVAALEERFLGAFPAFSSHLSTLYNGDHQ